MNILDVVPLYPCTSCGVCATICAKKAISMQLDEEGFYRPIVDVNLCNDCGLCTTVCYKFDSSVKKTTEKELKQKPLFSAWATDDDIVRNTTSGGIGDLLAHQLMNEGYKVVGVVYNEDGIRAEHRIATKEDELDSFRGSKYIQSYTFDAFKEVVLNCRNEKYAVFGTPCQIYALNRMATRRKVRDQFFFVDLYCHGCPSLHAWTKYQSDIKKSIGVNRFDSVTFRSKISGWGGFYIVETKLNGKTVYVGKKANDKFYELFFSEHILNEACHDCMLRSTLEYTDIRIGDFWGPKFLNNQRGVSAISIATQKGGKLFRKLQSVTCSQCSYDEFLPYQSWNLTYKVDMESRKAVLASLANPDEEIDTAITVLRQHQGIVTKVKRFIKTVLAMFPLGLTNSAKKIVYIIR